MIQLPYGRIYMIFTSMLLLLLLILIFRSGWSSSSSSRRCCCCCHPATNNLLVFVDVVVVLILLYLLSLIHWICLITILSLVVPKLPSFVMCLYFIYYLPSFLVVVDDDDITIVVVVVVNDDDDDHHRFGISCYCHRWTSTLTHWIFHLLPPLPLLFVSTLPSLWLMMNTIVVYTTSNNSICAIAIAIWSVLLYLLLPMNRVILLLPSLSILLLPAYER